MRVVKPSEFHKYPGGTLYYYVPNIGLDVKMGKEKGVQKFIPLPDQMQSLSWMIRGNPEYFKDHYTCDLTAQSYPNKPHKHSKKEDKVCPYTGYADHYLVFDLDELEYMRNLLDKAIDAAKRYSEIENDPNEYKFTIYWLDGATEELTGKTLTDALKRAGYSAGAVDEIGHFTREE